MKGGPRRRDTFIHIGDHQDLLRHRIDWHADDAPLRVERGIIREFPQARLSIASSYLVPRSSA
jgi:hypothetical protein